MEMLMTYEEFIRDVRIKNKHHERIAKLFYSYFRCVSGDINALSEVVGSLIGVDFSNTMMQTGCLNGIFDNSVPPFENVDLYIKFKNDIRVFVYGVQPTTGIVKLNENEYVLLVLSDNIFSKIERKDNRYTYILD